MSRPDGFPTADVDVDVLADDRILAAVRQAGPWAALAYLAVVTASWARGERSTFQAAVDRLPRVYDVGDVDELEAALIAAGLLDDAGRIPASTWASWYEPAQARRLERREAGRRGGLAKAANVAAEHPPGAPRKRSSSAATSSATASLYPTDRPTDDATNVASVGLSPSAAADPDGPRRRSPPDEPPDLWPMVDGRVQVPQGPTTFPAPPGYVDPVTSFDEMAARAEPGSFLAQALERKRARASG